MAKRNNIESVDFSALIKKKKIPVLTLDSRWHELFLQYDKPLRIKALEKKLNNLIKQQGKEVSQIKELKKLKKTILDKIVENMNAANHHGENLDTKKQLKSQEIVNEINDKLQNAEQAIMDLPYEIKAVNEELMLASMRVCYEQLKINQTEIIKSEGWIKRAREELKNRILEKQDREIKNALIYNYMHDTLGAEAINMLDKEEGL